MTEITMEDYKENTCTTCERQYSQNVIRCKNCKFNELYDEADRGKEDNWKPEGWFLVVQEYKEMLSIIDTINDQAMHARKRVGNISFITGLVRDVKYSVNWKDQLKNRVLGSHALADDILTERIDKLLERDQKYKMLKDEHDDTLLVMNIEHAYWQSLLEDGLFDAVRILLDDHDLIWKSLGKYKKNRDMHDDKSETELLVQGIVEKIKK